MLGGCSRMYCMREQPFVVPVFLKQIIIVCKYACKSFALGCNLYLIGALYLVELGCIDALPM